MLINAIDFDQLKDDDWPEVIKTVRAIYRVGRDSFAKALMLNSRTIKRWEEGGIPRDKEKAKIKLAYSLANQSDEQNEKFEEIFHNLIAIREKTESTSSVDLRQENIIGPDWFNTLRQSVIDEQWNAIDQQSVFIKVLERETQQIAQLSIKNRIELLNWIGFAKFMVGMPLIAENYFNDAIELLNQQTGNSLDFIRQEIYNNLGLCKMRLGLFEDSMHLYNQALELDPNYYPSLGNKVALNSLIVNYKEALICYNALCKSYPEVANEATKKGKSLRNDKDLKGFFNSEEFNKQT